MNSMALPGHQSIDHVHENHCEPENFAEAQHGPAESPLEVYQQALRSERQATGQSQPLRTQTSHQRSISQQNLLTDQSSGAVFKKTKNVRIAPCSSMLNVRARPTHHKGLSASERPKNNPFNPRGTTTHALRSMLQESDPIFYRNQNPKKSQEISKPFNKTFTTFKGRIQEKYDPAQKLEDLHIWDRNKNDTLEEMRKNMSLLEQDAELVGRIGKLKNLTSLSRKFPTYQKYMALGSRYVSNDAHNKITGPGFNRNDYGKPYFS